MNEADNSDNHPPERDQHYRRGGIGRVQADSRPPPMTFSPELLELHYVYESLAHPRRRYLLYTLLEDTEWTLHELATKLVAFEDQIPEEDVSTEQRSMMYVSLQHNHVPKLVDLGVIEFDDAAQVIWPAEYAPQVLVALEGIGASLDSQQESHARREYHESTD